MKGNFSKRMIASAVAVMMTASSHASVLGLGAVSAGGIELPTIPYDLTQKEAKTFTFQNNTDFVTAWQNGRVLKSTDTIDNDSEIVLTSLDQFTYTINGVMYSAGEEGANSYKVEITPYGNFTVEKNYKHVQHDDGFYGVSNSYIFLFPGLFNEQDMFYVDKSISGGVFDVQRNGRTLSFKTHLNYPVSIYDADTQTKVTVKHDSTTFRNTVTLPSSTYSGKLFVVRDFEKVGDFDVNMLPMIPDEAPFTVTHTSAMGKQEEIALGKGFATSDYLMEVDGAFSKSAVWGFWRDKTAGTGIVSVNAGTGFSVYNIFGEKVDVTKLGSSDDTREIYSFRAYCDITYYLVKDSTTQPTGKYLKGDVNSDGVVDIMDVVLLRQYLANMNVEINAKAADVYTDNSIDKIDAVELTRYVSGQTTGI
jgi:hypothetical protein